MDCCEELNLSDSYGVASFVKVDRDANICDHSLAKRAAELKESELW